jgi:murein DD-endopeptidase MepM/ murein hydrolase activator NlpD
MLTYIPAIQPISINSLDRISDYYGYRKDPFTGEIRRHNGIDFAGILGSNIYATGDGIVVEARYTFHGYGKKVAINHGFGYVTIYGHLRKINVKKGDKVKRGQTIGELGSTGRSTGPHLHYEIRKFNLPVNPINFYYNDINAAQYDSMITVMAKNRNPMD